RAGRVGNHALARGLPALAALELGHVVAEPPATELGRFETHEHTVIRGNRLRIRPAVLRAEVADSHRADRFGRAVLQEARLAAHLEAAVRRLVLVDDDACPR